MDSRTIRAQFIKFFENKGHTFVPSAPVLPAGDATLLFTNAGMNQFKDIFLGEGSRPYARAVNSQKCIRVSGKHNDLEEVGKDTYHHTFFEMLGNWSFGDYYKTEAVQWAWELLTGVWKLPKAKLYATVYTADAETAQIWRDKTDIDPAHISFFEKENFWEMGETGPCGPCSEIHIDLGPDRCDKKNIPGHICGVNSGCGRFIELWNLVFMQYNRDASGRLAELPKKHVDTGMGFERVCAVLQNVVSNYDTDIFTPLIRTVEEISGVQYQPGAGGMPHRVIADHLRMLSFAVADGVLPSNEGRGYVLRRILRRAARYGRRLGLREPFLCRLTGTLVDAMGTVFPEIKDKRGYVEKILQAEERSFNKTLDRGLELFAELTAQVKKSGQKIISGAEVFKLYDTYGFPADLTAVLAEEQGLSVDLSGFAAEMQKQRDKARAAGLGAKSGVGGEIVLEAGDETAKQAMARHHTATHLLHAALQKTLGKHATQAGSLVAPEKLRFDFNHFQALTSEEKQKIEELVNAEISRNTPLTIEEMPIQAAKASGALSLFGEKYGEIVRVVGIGDFSREFCGGHHVKNTGELKTFKLISESALSAGVRRIEAVAGDMVAVYYQKELEKLNAELSKLNLPELKWDADAAPAELDKQLRCGYQRLEQRKGQLRQEQKQSEKQKLQTALAGLPEYAAQKKVVNGMPVIAVNIGAADRNTVVAVADSLQNQLGGGVVVLGAADNGKALLVASVAKKHQTPELNAGKIIQNIAPFIEGRGGGRPELAQAGGQRPDGINAALRAVVDMVGHFGSAR
ncbi:MAG: alanine--tRNA ligase [Candidatus Margulisbacteria bacterium]|jgi:alanyl-tRNA synthetase|nr:alanine--tRNA ligase [Candidatus Margulisiibacteriota bacterium]